MDEREWGSGECGGSSVGKQGYKFNSIRTTHSISIYQNYLYSVYDFNKGVTNVVSM
ncbi:hypothetical protein GcM1_100001 [Golovinomyces cichoracearum]|uniref:Uncharacterized protein n=1 Tax=Golovinomyces cichoracearum TaxID=62708 RepID=A0A420JC28_9PEZI|nr:hypothetical protein GcM1_100001 [Golovinomyces cichoracearum]